MKKTKLTRSLLAACSIVALSAVMYGCAHTDSGPSQDELDAANEATAAAEAEAKISADATDAAVAAKVEADAAAETARIAREAADAAADKARLAQEAAEAQSALDAQAKIDADAAAAEAAAAQMKAEEEAAAALEAQMKAEEKAAAAEEAQMEAEDEEAAAAAELADKEAAEKAEMLGALYAGIFAADDSNVMALDFVAPRISASLGMMAGIAAPIAGDGMDAAFATTGTRMMLGDLGDWTGTDMSARNAPAGFSDHVQVYTDIEVGSEISFGTLFPGTAGVLDDEYNERDNIVNAGGLNDYQGLVEAMVENDDGEMEDAFQTGSGTRQHGDALRTTETIIIPGMFAGASGDFRCAKTANDCISVGTNAGTRFDGMWTFVVDSGEMATVPDGDFSHFGWWLREFDTGGKQVDVFHGSTEDMAPIVTALTGSAKYVGQAAGKAVINPQLPGEVLIGGTFTADATLTANFEAGPAATEPVDLKDGGVSGTINNFTVDGEEVDWNVALGFLSFTDDSNEVATPVGDPAGSDNNVTWSIDGEASTVPGGWRASFWGPGTDGVPGSVTGNFWAWYNDEVGRMEGAFGANKE